MKTLFTIGCLFTLLSANAAFAQGKLYFFGQQLETGKSVQLVGAARTAENLEREDHVRSIVELHMNQLRYCYEKVLAQGSLGNIDTTFYFTVGSDGTFSNVSADVNARDKFIDDSNLTALFNCESKQIQSFHAGKSGADSTFRLRARFSAQ